MKKLLVLTAIIAASFITTKGYSQVFVGARIGLPHIGIGIGVPVVAPVPCVAPAPAPVVYNDFPGYAYYNYPAWNGHFRDRVYYEHYQPIFLHSHPYYRRGRW